MSALGSEALPLLAVRRRMFPRGLAAAGALAGALAAFAPGAFAQYPEDFDLATGNDDPAGLWATDTRVYVLDVVDTDVYVYNRQTGAEISGEKLTLPGLGSSPLTDGIWSNGTTLWVADAGNNRVRAYTLADGTRDNTNDFNLHANNGTPSGLWSDGATMYVAEAGTSSRLFRYDLNNSGNHLGNCVLANTTTPTGIHGRAQGIKTTLWVSDSGVTTARAYTSSCGRSSSDDITYANAGVGASPGGIGGSNSGTAAYDIMLFADDTNDRVRAWNHRADARLATPFMRHVSSPTVTEGGTAWTNVVFKATDSASGADYVPFAHLRPSVGGWRAIRQGGTARHGTACSEANVDYVDIGNGAADNTPTNADLVASDVVYTTASGGSTLTANNGATPSAFGRLMPVETCDDGVHEGVGTNGSTETLRRGFGTFSNLRLGGGWPGVTAGATGGAYNQNIQDGDVGVSFSSGASVAEGGSITLTLNVTHNVPAATGFPVTVGQGSLDFLAAGDIGTRTVTVAMNQNSATFTISLPEDNLDEDSGSLTFDFDAATMPAGYGPFAGPFNPAATNPGPGEGVPNSPEHTIGATDNDPAPFLAAVENVTVDEAATHAVFTMGLVNSGGTAVASGREVRLTFTTEGGGTATAGQDYVADTSLVATIPPGQMSARFSVELTPDNVGERPETIILAPTGNPVNAQFMSGVTNLTYRPTVTINDDDAAALDFELLGGSTMFDEGAEAVFRVSLQEASTEALPVSVTITDPRGAVVIADSTAVRPEGHEQLVTIPAGQTSADFTLSIVQDNTDEEDSPVTVAVGGSNFEGPGATHSLLTPSISFTVRDDEAPPVLTVADSGGPEGMGNAAVFAVLLAPAMGEINGDVSEFSVFVDYRAYAKAGDTAGAGTDFEGEQGSLTFQPGETERRVTIDIYREDDDMLEETFTFELSNADLGNASFPGGAMTVEARGTIQELPSLMIAADDADGAVSEAEAATFTVSLSRLPSDGAAVTVPVTVAVTGNLFGALPDSLTIPAGELSAALDVPLNNDARDEDDGSITVTISLPAGREDDFLFRSAASATAMLAVTDDDEPPSVSVIGAETVREGETLVFPVRVSAESERGISVMYGTADAGASAGSDYEAASGLLSFAPGATELQVEVVTLEDTATDPNEKVAVVLSQPLNATLDAARAEGTIIEGLSDAEIQALNEAIIPHVITALSEETTGAIQDRVRAVFDGGGAAAAEGLRVRGATPGQFIKGLLPGEVGTALNAFRHSGEPADRHSRGSSLQAQGNPEIPGAALDSRFRGNDGGAYGNNGAAPATLLRIIDNGGIDWALPQFSAADFNFNASLNADGGGFSLPPINVWGRGYYRDLSVEAEGNPISFEGDILGFILGADARFTDAFLAGISLNHTRADLDWDNSKFTGAHETALTSIHPYAAWQLDSGLLVWSSLGYGEGDLELTEDGNAAFSFEHDVSVGTAAIGGYGPLPSAGPVDFGIIADAAYARTDGDSGTPAVESGWLRAGVEADYDYGLSDGSALSVKGELALRGDFGDAKSGGGVELASQFAYQHPLGIRADLKARALLSHEDDEVEEWGISGGVAYTTPGIGGFAIAFSPEWGIANSARDRILNGGFADMPGAALASGRAARAQPVLRYNLEMQYGIPIFHDRESLIFSARSSFRNDARADLRFECRF